MGIDLNLFIKLFIIISTYWVCIVHENMLKLRIPCNIGGVQAKCKVENKNILYLLSPLLSMITVLIWP